MTKALEKQRVTSVTGDTSLTHEIYKITYAVLLISAILIGAISFVALGAGILKVLMGLIA